PSALIIFSEVDAQYLSLVKGGQETTLTARR
ncbi:hypothetical protein ACVL5V_008566, partial [Bradyrhizobium ottawaense]